MLVVWPTGVLAGGGHRGGSLPPNFGLFENCPKIFSLSESICPKMQNVWLWAHSTGCSGAVPHLSLINMQQQQMNLGQ